LEFVDHLRKFPEWLKGKLGEYKEWFNHPPFTEATKRFQRSSTSVTLETDVAVSQVFNSFSCQYDSAESLS
jgi:hypothetical protein